MKKDSLAYLGIFIVTLCTGAGFAAGFMARHSFSGESPLQRFFPSFELCIQLMVLAAWVIASLCVAVYCRLENLR